MFSASFNQTQESINPTGESKPSFLLQRLFLANMQHPADFVRLEAEGLRTLDTGKRDDVVQLFHDSFDSQPVHGIACPQIDDLQSTPGLGLFFSQIVVQWQIGECAILSLLRQTHDCEVTRKREPSHVTWAKGDLIEGAGFRVDGPQVASA